MLRRIAFGIVLAFLLLWAMVFTALNQQQFVLDVAVAEFEVASGLALVIAFAAGLLAGSFARSRWVAELLAERGRLRLALRLAERRLGATPSASAPSGPSSPSLPSPPSTPSDAH